MPKSAKSAKAPVPKPAQVKTRAIRSIQAPTSQPTPRQSPEACPEPGSKQDPRTYNEPAPELSSGQVPKPYPIIIEVNVEPSMRV